MPRKLTPEEKQNILNLYSSLPEDMTNKYEIVSKQVGKAKSAVYNLVIKSKQVEPEIRYFDYKTFPF